MVTQNRYLAVDDFLNKLNATSLTGNEMSQLLLNEVRRIERLKIALVDEDIHNDPASVVLIVNDIDSYILTLQEVLADLKADSYSREVLSSSRVSQIRDQIIKLINRES
ncbi:hypothetical protein [Pontibacter vulgaris]|uniref:hypothetical protein n=1 Tax=Pontibacter vulgaris TaxID=2905679 RepID=UPI001FA78C38|nr:hypothetical protein [Pontibacter vulgaris]